MRLLYVLDPMCSWCYAFQPELEALLAAHPTANIEWIMGGLAPDSQHPMDDSLKQTIASYWHQIESKTQVSFNHDFWHLNTPYRSTYPACRAVISAEQLLPNSAQIMVKAIQSVYYLDAKNPSLEATLINCANAIGLDENQFVEVFKSDETEQHLQQHLQLTRQLQVRGFPALFYIDEENRAHPVAMGFSQFADLERNLRLVSQSKR
ncbi:DsbA family protein [Shewanella maritima]|uniref:DsbA family protein n=1 Tax=Shewanella maritima TaxID=2520507 RepID=UPI003735DB84